LIQQTKIRPTTGSKKKGQADDYDKMVGQRIKQLRKEHKLTQSDVANALGVTFQQIQKYEKGQDRISFNRVFELSKFMDLDLDSFAPLLDEAGMVYGLSDAPQEILKANANGNDISKKEIKEVLRFYGSVKKSTDRKKLMNIIKAAAENFQ